MTALTTATATAITAPSFNSCLMDRFIGYLDTSKKTVETYRTSLRQFFTYLTGKSISNPQREDILAYKEELKATGHKATTIQNYITAIRLFFQWTALEGIYPNIADHIKGAKISREHKKDSFTVDQVRDFLNSIDTSSLQGKRDYAILLLMVSCGLRDIEVQRANVEDMRTVGNFTALYVMGKGREEKTEFVKVPYEVEKAIRGYLKARGTAEPSAPLFSSLDHKCTGSRLSTRSISRIAKETFRAVGLDSERLTAHSLRHTAVTFSLMGGNSLEDTKEFARHKDISTTMIYNHALDRAKNNCSNTVSNYIFGR